MPCTGEAARDLEVEDPVETSSPSPTPETDEPDVKLTLSEQNAGKPTDTSNIQNFNIKNQVGIISVKTSLKLLINDF